MVNSRRVPILRLHDVRSLEFLRYLFRLQSEVIEYPGHSITPPLE